MKMPAYVSVAVSLKLYSITYQMFMGKKAKKEKEIRMWLLTGK